MVGRDFNMGSSGCGSNKSHNDTPLSTSSGVSGDIFSRPCDKALTFHPLKGSGSQQSGNSQESGLAQLHHRLAFLNPWRNKDDGSDSGTADMRGVDTSPGKAGFDLPGRSTSPVGSAKKRTRAKDPRVTSSAKRRRIGLPAGSYKGSYKMEDSFSSSDESGQDDERAKAAAGVHCLKENMIFITFAPPFQVKTISTDKHMTNNLKLSDNDLWQISAQMNAIKWRALGRTLGLDEDILLNLEHAHKSGGVRECAYQMLLEWKVNKEIILYRTVLHYMRQFKLFGRKLCCPILSLLWQKVDMYLDSGSKTKTDYFWSPFRRSSSREYEHGGNPHGKSALQQATKGPDELITNSNHYNQYKLHHE